MCHNVRQIDQISRLLQGLIQILHGFDKRVFFKLLADRRFLLLLDLNDRLGLLLYELVTR